MSAYESTLIPMANWLIKKEQWQHLKLMRYFISPFIQIK